MCLPDLAAIASLVKSAAPRGASDCDAPLGPVPSVRGGGTFCAGPSGQNASLFASGSDSIEKQITATAMNVARSLPSSMLNRLLCSQSMFAWSIAAIAIFF